MGCSYSNLEPDENRPPAGRFALQWLRLRRGKNCIISTTELLHRDNPDAATTATPRSDWKVHSGRSKLTVCKDNEEDKGGSTMRSNNEELPGSPSFRFYFNAQPVASDDDGLKMLCLYSSEDAQGLLMAAVRDPDSVVFLENEFLYGESFPVSAEVLDSSFCLPIGKAKAADILSKEGINTELNSHSKEFM